MPVIYAVRRKDFGFVYRLVCDHHNPFSSLLLQTSMVPFFFFYILKVLFSAGIHCEYKNALTFSFGCLWGREIVKRG